jgi:APA family basic amino acid/polyamine antiporter
VLAVTLLVPFERLLAVSNAITLAIFAVVDLALWKLRLLGPPATDGFHVQAWVPPTAAASSLALMAGEFLF